MKNLLFLLCFLLCAQAIVHAQPPKPDPAEMQKMIADLKKEIADTEEEIKRAEKEDPEEAAMLKKQLATYKSLLSAFDKSKPVPAKAAAPAPKALPVQSFSPIVHVVLKQPVTPPTAGQDKDVYFWYRGKKVNDSTLVTRRGTVVQYSKKRSQLIVEPEKKKDTFFLRVANEIARNNERKDALVNRVAKMKNGFTQYTNMVGAVGAYDDLAIRFSEAVNNTFSFDNVQPPTGLVIRNEGEYIVGRGPARNDEGEPEDVREWAQNVLKKANQEFQQLPPVESFPAPPRREMGMCISCDTNKLKLQRKIDEEWYEKYQGQENAILRKVLSAMRFLQLSGHQEIAADILDEMTAFWGKIIARMEAKNKVLAQRVGNDFQYASVVVPVLLGHERQLQLLGAGEFVENNNFAMQYFVKTLEVYAKYYKEQAASKNHDFILDLPIHLGVERQKQLLGSAANGDDDPFANYLSYNRFALTMDVDFMIQDNPDDFTERYTGNMAMKDKVFTMLIRDSCRFKMIPYQQDLMNSKVEDIVLDFVVQGGQKIVVESDGKKKTIPYTGPASWAVRIPETRIHFCNDGVPDTMFLSNFFIADKAVAASLSPSAEMNRYALGMGAMGQLVWVAENAEVDDDRSAEKSQQMLDAVAKSFSKEAPADPLGKMRVQYEGWTDIRNSAQEMVSTVQTEKSRVLFQSGNRATVVTDTYQDTKRETETFSIKRAMTHIRIVHDPVSK